MRVVLIAPVSPEQIAEIGALDGRLEITNAWELFGPELVADWPPQTVEWYLPRRFRGLPDSPEQRQQRDELLREAEVLCLTFPFPRRLVGRAPRLRLVQQLPAGVSNLTWGDLWGSSVPVASGRGASRPLPIAEWVLAATLALAKELPRAFAQQASGHFDRTAFRGKQLAGKTMGIVGLGGIGRNVARLARGVGMRVIGTRRSAEPVEHVEQVLPPRALHSLLAQSDVVVLCCQLTAETHHLMNAAAFAALKPGALLLNVARGELIDEAALGEALRAGRLGGLALDVYEGEFEHQPPTALLRFDNVIVTPHTSGQSDQPADEPLEIFKENLRRVLDGRPLLNQVDWERGY